MLIDRHCFSQLQLLQKQTFFNHGLFRQIVRLIDQLLIVKQSLTLMYSQRLQNFYLLIQSFLIFDYKIFQQKHYFILEFFLIKIKIRKKFSNLFQALQKKLQFKRKLIKKNDKQIWNTKHIYNNCRFIKIKVLLTNFVLVDTKIRNIFAFYEQIKKKVLAFQIRQNYALSQILFMIFNSLFSSF
ncbi:hypothetical protein ABPG74_012868 [Tetrahymena malaccensis]